MLQSTRVPNIVSLRLPTMEILKAMQNAEKLGAYGRIIRMPHLNFAKIFCIRKLDSLAIMRHCFPDFTFNHSHTKLECDRQTDTHKDRTHWQIHDVNRKATYGGCFWWKVGRSLDWSCTLPLRYVGIKQRCNAGDTPAAGLRSTSEDIISLSVYIKTHQHNSHNWQQKHYNCGGKKH